MKKKQLLASIFSVFLLLSFASLLLIPTTAAQATYSITLAEGVGGHISGRAPSMPLTHFAAGTYTVDENTAIRFYTQSSAGYVFDRFEITEGIDNGNTTTNPLDITVVSAFTITAYFLNTSQGNAVITLEQSLGGAAYYTYNGYTLLFPDNGQMQTVGLAIGSTITVYGQGTLGYTFSNLEVTDGILNGKTTSNPAVFTIVSSFKLRANFEVNYTSGDLRQVTILWTPNYPTDAGTVTFSYHSAYQLPGMTNPIYTNPGTYILYNGSTIILTATPKPGNTFLNWVISGGSQNGNITTNPLTLTITSNFTVTAVFTLPSAPDNIDFAKFETDIISLIEVLIGVLILFCSIAVFMKAPDAWLIGLFLLIAGFILCLAGQPNIMGVVVFAIAVLLSAVFLYTGVGKKTK